MDLIMSLPKSLIKRLTKSIRYLLLELPRLSSIVNNKGKSNSFIDNTQHKDVNVGLPKLPVGSINTQNQFILPRQ